MKIGHTVISINQGGTFVIESPDIVAYCVIEIKKSTPGVEHPIVIKSGAVFECNSINSEIDGSILCDARSGSDFSSVRDNLVRCSLGNEVESDIEL